MSITVARKERARKLIASADHRGNHGFKGIQLRAWRTQRSAILLVLRKLAQGRPPTLAQKNVAEYGNCPRFVGMGAGGNAAGEQWVWRSRSLIDATFEGMDLK